MHSAIRLRNPSCAVIDSIKSLKRKLNPEANFFHPQRRFFHPFFFLSQGEFFLLVYGKSENAANFSLFPVKDLEKSRRLNSRQISRSMEIKSDFYDSS